MTAAELDDPVLFPDWLHTAQRSGSALHDGEVIWEGRVQAMQRALKSEVGSVRTELERTNRQIEQQDEKMSQIMQQLAQMQSETRRLADSIAGGVL